MLGNLRSITNKTMQETQKSKLGLVVEGGGVRAIYAAGVLDVLHDMCLPFSGVIGVSAEHRRVATFTEFRLCRARKAAAIASIRVFAGIRGFSVSKHGFAPATSLTTTFAIGKSLRNSSRSIRKRSKLPAWNSGQ